MSILWHLYFKHDFHLILGYIILIISSSSISSSGGGGRSGSGSSKFSLHSKLHFKLRYLHDSKWSP
jgi:hypothetical protein